MKRLTLFRHAKSSWGEPDLDDYDRPLNDRGISDAPMMSQRMLDENLTPDLILCSSAKRTKQTVQFFIDIHTLNDDAVSFHDKLYLASAGTLLQYIQNTDESVNHLMVVAHNPGLETLGRQLHPQSPANLVTCGRLDFSLSGESFVIGPKTEIELCVHDFPKA